MQKQNKRSNRKIINVLHYVYFFIYCFAIFKLYGIKHYNYPLFKIYIGFAILWFFIATSTTLWLIYSNKKKNTGKV